MEGWNQKIRYCVWQRKKWRKPENTTDGQQCKQLGVTSIDMSEQRFDTQFSLSWWQGSLVTMPPSAPYFPGRLFHPLSVVHCLQKNNSARLPVTTSMANNAHAASFPWRWPFLRCPALRFQILEKATAWLTKVRLMSGTLFRNVRVLQVSTSVLFSLPLDR